MNYGPLIFLAAFFALSSSWFGLVLTPQIQLGRMQPTNSIPSGATYPVLRPGLARQGLDVYRSQGCAACHTQQVGQKGTAIDVMLLEVGTNRPALLSVLATIKPGLTDAAANELLGRLPDTLLRDQPKTAAGEAVKALTAAGAKAKLWIVPYGPDLARGWGKRRSVAEDYLYDNPVMLGSQRIGPDLTDLGVRKPDANWQLRHLYAPASEVPGSPMPPYRFLFEKRRVDHGRSTEALALPAGSDPGPDYEIVPKPEATALVAYLMSLRADTPLFVAPYSVASLPSAAAGTNAPTAASAGSTNAPVSPSTK